MFVYRIAKSAVRTKDISGIGAYREGGRWNSAGIYMLYTSENSSLAYLENLVHFEEANIPPDLFITKIELKAADPLIYQLPDKAYLNDWLQLDNLNNKALGDKLMAKQQYLAIKVRSAVNPSECNFLLNPLFSQYHQFVQKFLYRNWMLI